MTTLIPENDIWTIWAIVICITALAFFLEQRFKWGAKISSVLLALIGSLILVNLRVLPTSSPVYDSLGGYILPLAIPLLLFRSDLRKIIKESGSLLIILLLQEPQAFWEASSAVSYSGQLLRTRRPVM